MLRATLLALAFIAACGPGERDHEGAPLKLDAARIDTPVPVDSPPRPQPSVDAGAPPTLSCGEDAGACEPPPSTCLDSNYLLYYTGGTCTAGTCELITNLLYCPGGCSNGGCQGGFT